MIRHIHSNTVNVHRGIAAVCVHFLECLHLMSTVALQWLHKINAMVDAMLLSALPGSWLPADQS